jgi:hypothetical protein
MDIGGPMADRAMNRRDCQKIKMDINKMDARTSRLDKEVVARELASPKQERLPKWNVALPIIILAAFFVALMVHFAYKGDLYLSFWVDDFFYYLVVAKNLALHGASTFNGLQATNGYHPLWMLTIALLYKIFHTQLSFFVALSVLIWLLVCGSYPALRRTQLSLGIGGDAGLAWALLSITCMAALSRTGMEIGLALFCLSLFWERMATRPLERQTPAAAFVSGLLASALVLSRLDACLVVAAYGGLTLIAPSSARRTAVKQVFYFAAGLFPLAIYFAINRIEFGTMLPISGVAKNLKSTWFPSSSTVSMLALPRLLNILFTWPSLTLCALFLLHVLRGPANAESLVPADRRRVQLCVALHPIIFYSVLSFSTDWPMWWIWYLYPLVPVFALLGPTVVARWIPLTRSASLWLAAAVTCCSLVIILDRVRTERPAVFALQRALGLQAFAAAHPGIFSMGDTAGLPSYLMPAPVLQLEGLMADKSFVDRIRRQEPLLQALNELGVDYYVTVRAQTNHDCYDVREPYWAGPHSPAMQARLCMHPVADIGPPGDPHHALVFDVRALPTAGAPAESN